jgi:DNA-binding NtrC family response regulator
MDRPAVLITVPPLRDRLGDLLAMIDAFLREATIRGRARKLRVTPEAMRLLAAYPWPGNVRELRSEVHRWAVFCDDEVAPAISHPRSATAPRDEHATRHRRARPTSRRSPPPCARPSTPRSAPRSPSMPATCHGPPGRSGSSATRSSAS